MAEKTYLNKVYYGEMVGVGDGDFVKIISNYLFFYKLFNYKGNGIVQLRKRYEN